MSASSTRIYFLLQQAAHRLKKSADAALLESAGLTTAQAAVLVLISEMEPVTQREVAQRLGLNESAMTAMTGRLLKLGYIERVRSLVDARAWHLTVAAPGKQARQRMQGPFGRINRALDDALSEREMAAFASYLRRIIDTCSSAH